MVLRFLLLLLILICLLIVVFIKKVKVRYAVGVVALFLFVMFAYTFTTANITVKSPGNKDILMENIVEDFPDDVSISVIEKEYITEINDSTDVFSSFTYTEYYVGEMPTDGEVYGIIEDIYMRGLDFPDKVLFKMLAPLLTQKINKNGVTLWVLPTLLEPYNPNSYFLKGCFYTEYYYNTFAWYSEGYLNMVYERCSSDIGKTDEQHLIEFKNSLKNTADGSVSSDEK